MVIQKNAKGLERNLELANSIRDKESAWKFENRYCSTEEDFNKYKQEIKEEYSELNNTEIWNFDSECCFEGAGYYDYNEDFCQVQLIASENQVYTQDVEMDIEYMDEPIQKIRERKLTTEIKAYVEDVLELRKFEGELDFVSTTISQKTPFKKLEMFLKEMRKEAFIFHEAVETRYTNEHIEGFKFVYYIESENWLRVERIIRYFRSNTEDILEDGRTE